MTISASKNALMLTVLSMLLASTYGCTACIVGPAASLAGAGVTRVEMGKVTRFELAQYEDVIEASRLAAENLALDLKKEKIEEN